MGRKMLPVTPAASIEAITSRAQMIRRSCLSLHTNTVDLISVIPADTTSAFHRHPDFNHLRRDTGGRPLSLHINTTLCCHSTWRPMSMLSVSRQPLQNADCGWTSFGLAPALIVTSTQGNAVDKVSVASLNIISIRIFFGKRSPQAGTSTVSILEA
jgi:hypothetical protein